MPAAETSSTWGEEQSWRSDKDEGYEEGDAEEGAGKDQWLLW
jgi:hypothetical protein